MTNNQLNVKVFYIQHLCIISQDKSTSKPLASEQVDVTNIQKILLSKLKNHINTLQNLEIYK